MVVFKELYKELGQVDYKDYISKLCKDHYVKQVGVLKDYGKYYLVEEYGNYLDIRYSIYFKEYYFDGDKDAYITSPVLCFTTHEKILAEEEFDKIVNQRLQSWVV